MSLKSFCHVHLAPRYILGTCHKRLRASVPTTACVIYTCLDGLSCGQAAPTMQCMGSEPDKLAVLRRSFGVLIHELITAEIPRRGKLRELKCALFSRPVSHAAPLCILAFSVVLLQVQMPRQTLQVAHQVAALI